MDDPRTTLLLRACASAQRRSTPFTQADVAASLRQLALAEGRPTQDASVRAELAAQIQELADAGLATAHGSGLWQLSERGEREIIELSDEHTDDVASLLDYLGET
jgi:hypothetical protein